MRALAAAVCAGLAFAVPALASEQQPTQRELETEIVCPVCAPETLDQSSSPVAERMKRFIARRIAAGDTKSEIKEELVAQFGKGVLAAPPREGFDLLAWLLPLGGVFAAAVLLGALAWRWSRVREAAPAPDAIDPRLERRLDEELSRLD